MKATISTLSFFFLLSTALPAQIDCTKFLEQGKKAAAKENFELAMNSFNSARRCGDQAMGELVDKEVTKLFNAINKKKEQAEQEKQRAEEQQKIAEQEKQRAEAQTKIARAARDSVATLLQKFEAASAEIVDALAREANNLIYHLNYDAATAKLHTAADLNQPTVSFKKALAEVAFFWNETGQTAQAADLLAAAKQSDAPREQATLRAWLKQYAGAWYDSLMLRYYPSMVPVPAGEAIIEGKKAPVSAFQMARTEMTMWQYAIFVTSRGIEMRSDKNLGAFLSWGFNGDNPVVNVSCYDAVLYANWLSEKSGLQMVYTIDSSGKKFQYEWNVRLDSSARGYRLPTEIEWEYAARGGPTREEYKYAGGNELDSVGWYSDNSGSRTQPVADKKANSLGLYDMSGNVWEWCGDWYAGNYPTAFPANYRGPDSGNSRVLRGGSWLLDAKYSRTTYRSFAPLRRDNGTGFRLVFSP